MLTIVGRGLKKEIEEKTKTYVDEIIAYKIEILEKSKNEFS
jgi:hypothetical protein